jgi:hypothetical protein
VHVPGCRPRSPSRHSAMPRSVRQHATGKLLAPIPEVIGPAAMHIRTHVFILLAHTGSGLDPAGERDSLIFTGECISWSELKAAKHGEGSCPS